MQRGLSPVCGASARCRPPSPGKLAIDVELRTVVQELLDRRWSPEQISQQLSRTPRHRAGGPEAHLPNGKTSTDVRDALIGSLGELPAQLRRSLTWDQGREMARHREFSLATDMAVYFCDPASPWQRGSNENTNGLLRQYFPKSTDLTAHTREHLAAVAAELNARPRETLGWDTPAERLNRLLKI